MGCSEPARYNNQIIPPGRASVIILWLQIYLLSPVACCQGRHSSEAMVCSDRCQDATLASDPVSEVVEIPAVLPIYPLILLASYPINGWTWRGKVNYNIGRGLQDSIHSIWSQTVTAFIGCKKSLVISVLALTCVSAIVSSSSWVVVCLFVVSILISQQMMHSVLVKFLKSRCILKDWFLCMKTCI